MVMEETFGNKHYNVNQFQKQNHLNYLSLLIFKKAQFALKFYSYVPWIPLSLASEKFLKARNISFYFKRGESKILTSSDKFGSFTMSCARVFCTTRIGLAVV